MNKITGAKLLVNTLEKLNVDHIFGIPGIHNLDVYEEMIDSSINHITARNESGAGFMADGYARVSGKPGVALTITGPGLTNIITPMGQALHDSIPMVVISSQIPTTVLNQGTGFLHELKNSTILAQSVAKESRTVLCPEDIGLYIQEAYYLSMSDRPGPVHVEIPLDILRAYINEKEVPAYIQRKSISNSIIDESIVKDATKMLNDANTVAIITGGGAVNCSKEVLSISNKLAAPVVQTVAGKGIIDESHPLCLGTRLHCPEIKGLLKNVDVVLGIGTQLSSTDLWEVPLSLNGKLIQIDIDSGQFSKNYPADIGIKGDSKNVLNALIPKLNGKKSFNKEDIVSESINKAKNQLKELSGIKDGFEYIEEMLKAIRKVLPRDGILCADMTTPAYIGLSEFEVYRERTFLHPVGFGTLGYALPAAIGAKIAQPQKVVCALEGDGGFQFTMQELAVAIEQEISLPIIIWNNNGYGEIARNEETRGFKKKIAVENINPDFQKLAAAYGIRSFCVRNSKEMEDALRESINEKKVSLIEIKVDSIGG